MEDFPRLTPIIASWVHKLLSHPDSLNQQFERHGSPLNIHSMKPFAANYHEYRAVLEEHGLDHLNFFARKANKVGAFVEEAERLGFGVDTASYRELKQSLDLGCAPERLVLTAAVKSERLIRLAVEHDVLVILDNLDECRLVNRIAEELGRPARIGLRISGFEVDGEALYSRFGFPIQAVLSLVSFRIGPESEFDHLVYEGLHFHLNGYSRRQRGVALLAAIECADDLAQAGIATRFIDIGGGFLVRYLEHREEWEHFFSELRRAVAGERSPITFANNGLGYQWLDGKVRGEPSVYPYYNETPRATFLSEILSTENGEGQSAASLLRERGIQLRMEPGRSLLDQAGVTIARVAFRKWDSQGDLLVGLEMNRTQMYSSSADFLLDPIVIPCGREEEESTETEPVPVYFTGAYCLESDILLKRKILLEQVPQIGDLVCFLNTAGYMMHFFESEAHLFELATNLIARPNGMGDGFHFQVDAEVEREVAYQ